MSNTQAMASSFKSDILNGLHAFGTSVIRAGTGADTFKAALYLASASLGAGTTAYSATGEVSGSGYSAGGIAVTNATPPAVSGTAAIWTPSASLNFGTVTLSSSFDTVLIYNNTASGKNAVSVHTFGAQTVTAGSFVLTMPSNTAGNALIQIS